MEQSGSARIGTLFPRHQADANQSQLATETLNLSGTKLTRRGISGGACQLECITGG